MKGKSGFLPIVFGCHSSCSAPCGKYTKPRRRAGLAAGSASAVVGGIIASRSGSAIVAPAPLSTVRRDKCLRVRNIVYMTLTFSGRQVYRKGVRANLEKFEFAHDWGADRPKLQVLSRFGPRRMIHPC